MQNYWAGSNFSMVFDSGFGAYNYDIPFGSEWRIEYETKLKEAQEFAEARSRDIKPVVWKRR